MANQAKSSKYCRNKIIELIIQVVFKIGIFFKMFNIRYDRKDAAEILEKNKKQLSSNYRTKLTKNMYV